jgi:hypothetical protein
MLIPTYQAQQQLQTEPRIYQDCPKLQSRFATLIRKASQLCEMSETEICLEIRHQGRCYIFRTEDTAKGQQRAEAGERDLVLSKS